MTLGTTGDAEVHRDIELCCLSSIYFGDRKGAGYYQRGTKEPDEMYGILQVRMVK